MVAAALLFFSALRPQIETLHPLRRKRLRDAEADAAIAAGDDGDAAGQVEDAHGRFHLFGRFDVRPWQLFLANHGQARPKNQIWRSSIPIYSPRSEIRADHNHEETMQFKHVTVDFDGPVAILKLDHQEVMNAVSMDMLGGLGEALDAIDDSKAEVRCLVITGAGRAFCTGANLQGRSNQSRGRSNAGAALETAFHPFLRRLRNLHCPIVTSVNGPAAGAGMSIALMGDMILCARSSYFLQAFRRIGLVPDCGSTWLLPRLIGKARSVELSLMGERLPAEKALEWGLVNRVYDDAVLMDETMKLAHELANGPTVALSLIRKLYWESPEIRSRISSISNSIAARGGRGGGFQGRRHRVPRKTPGQVQRQMIEAQLGRCVASWCPGATGVAGAANFPAAPARRPGRSTSCIPSGNVGAILRRAPPGYGAAPRARRG